MGTVRTGEQVKYIESVSSSDAFYFDSTDGAELPCGDGSADVVC
jgi:hypothetical protein